MLSLSLTPSSTSTRVRAHRLFGTWLDITITIVWELLPLRWRWTDIEDRCRTHQKWLRQLLCICKYSLGIVHLMALHSGKTKEPVEWTMSCKEIFKILSLLFNIFDHSINKSIFWARNNIRYFTVEETKILLTLHWVFRFAQSNQIYNPQEYMHEVNRNL